MDAHSASLTAMLAMAAAPALAGSVTYNFSQGGYADGATIKGYFVGEDIDGNGELVYFGEGIGEGGIAISEITDFSLSFSGNSLIDSFTFGLSAVFGLAYTLDGGPLDDNADVAVEGIGASAFELEYLAGPGPMNGVPCDGATVVCGVISQFIEGPGGFDQTFELVQVNAVPVPVALPLMMFAIGALVF